MTYPQTAGFKEDGVSAHNAKLLDDLGVTSANCRKVADLYMSGFIGTATECAFKLGMRELQIRPRCSQLYKQDLLKRIGETKNQWGKKEYILAWNKTRDPQGDLFN